MAQFSHYPTTHETTTDYWLSHIRRSTLHQFDFSPCLLQTCLYNI